MILVKAAPVLTSHLQESMCVAATTTVLFVGNMEQRPWNFLVLGVFWPPERALQQSLLA